MTNVKLPAELSWEELFTIYERLIVELSDLGGRLGSEEKADGLLEEVEQVIRAIARHRAKSLHQVARKLKLAVELLDEATDPVAYDVVASAVGDLQALQ